MSSENRVVITVRCPHCKNKMKYQAAKLNRRKVCVYCGKSFKVDSKTIE
ncbi:MAG: hypothetical protein R6V53_07030 [Candidatus Woesearchaeota archaeon]